MHHHPPITITDDTSQILACLYRASSSLDDAALALRCAFAEFNLPGDTLQPELAGLDQLVRQLLPTQNAIRQFIDTLATTIEAVHPVGDLDTPFTDAAPQRPPTPTP